jgi:uncharacterized protein RhaS with RHS repeats
MNICIFNQPWKVFLFGALLLAGLLYTTPALAQAEESEEVAATEDPATAVADAASEPSISPQAVGAVDADVTFYHQDATGNLMAVTDASGQVVWRADVRPFGLGEAQSAERNPLTMRCISTTSR